MENVVCKGTAKWKDDIWNIVAASFSTTHAKSLFLFLFYLCLLLVDVEAMSHDTGIANFYRETKKKSENLSMGQ